MSVGMNRHKCMPTRGVGISWCVDGYEQALASAQRAHRETGVPIMIIRAPVDEIQQPLEVVGSEGQRRVRR
jgi:hypothetical protein